MSSELDLLACWGDEDRASSDAYGAICSVGVDCPGVLGSFSGGFGECRSPFGDEVCQDLGFDSGAGHKLTTKGASSTPHLLMRPVASRLRNMSPSRLEVGTVMS